MPKSGKVGGLITDVGLEVEFTSVPQDDVNSFLHQHVHVRLR
jgi:hypothetical protein